MDQIVILTIASICLLTAALVGLAFYRMDLDGCLVFQSIGLLVALSRRQQLADSG